MNSQRFIGLMSGTSMDAVDGVIAEFSAHKIQAIASWQLVMPPALRELLLNLAHSTSVPWQDLARADHALGQLFAHTVNELLHAHNLDPRSIAAIGSHGQTVFHDPNSSSPTSYQLGDPNVIAELTGITTVADFRRRDIAAAGQGAPLVPAFHHAAFASSDQSRVIVNIGGMANITVLPDTNLGNVFGFDTGPGNVLMDSWSQQHLGVSFDENGKWAAGGTVNQRLLVDLLREPYFSKAPPKSTGRELFKLTWLQQHLQRHKFASPSEKLARDIQATLCELTAVSICDAIKRCAAQTEEVFLCGGGAYNHHLTARLRALMNVPVRSTAELGIDPQHVEAIAFAWLAKQCMEHQTGNLPKVTGANHSVILGGIYQA